VKVELNNPGHTVFAEHDDNGPNELTRMLIMAA